MYRETDNKFLAKGDGAFVILGHYVNHGNEIINMKDTNGFQKLVNLFKYHGYPTDPKLIEGGTEWTIEDAVRNTFYNHTNCGDDENGYETALSSDNPYIRALVAANGKHLKELASDSNILVRQQVVDYLLSVLDSSATDELNSDHKEVLAIVLSAESKNLQAMSASS